MDGGEYPFSSAERMFEQMQLTLERMKRELGPSG